MIIDLLTNEEKKLISLKNYKAGEVLFYESDVASSIGVVLEGEIKISSVTFNGNEVIYNTIKKGMMFGNNLIFSTDNKYRGDVKATKNSKVYLIKKANLMRILAGNSSFLETYLSIQSDFTKALNSKIKLLTFTNAKERLFYYFKVNNNRIVYQNVTSLSHELYLSREATSRLISSLEKEGKISKKKHEIILLDSSF